MKTKHTSGPWETPGTDGGDRVISYTDRNQKRRTLAHVYAPRKDGELNEQERDANARLIATAPDLLEALKTLACSVDHEGAIHGRISQAYQQARAAIDKAEGR